MPRHILHCALAVGLTLGLGFPVGIARAADPEPLIVERDEVGQRPLALGIGKSVVIDLPRDAKDVLVANPQIANAVVRTARRAYLIGVAVGQTNVFFFDAEGRQIAGFDIAVKRDLNGIRTAIRQALPQGDIRVEAIGQDGVILIGSVANAGESQLAFEIATRLLGVSSQAASQDGSRIVNAITIRGRDQVMIKVTVAEMQRDVIKQLGIDLNGSLGYGTSVLNINQSNPFTAYGQSLSGSGTTASIKGVNATLRAMERAGVLRTLAEPNLTAISGETANFIVGGEFPIPSGLRCDTSTNPPACQPEIQFKKFGVGLTFTPVVLSEGRISLRLATEVSELSTENALTFGAGASTLTVPSIRARRAETTVEIPSGGSLALAGMIQEQTRQQINGMPGMMQVPILGTLFRSRDYVNRQSELVVLVTPYVVRATAAKELSKPDDGFADASDPQTVLLGRFNRIYGVAGRVDPKRSYHGKPGFIID